MVGANPDGIAIAPSGLAAYVADAGGNSVTPINLTTNVPGTPIPVGKSPAGIAIAPNGQTAYVTNGVDNTVTPINLANNTAGSPISVGSSPDAVAVTPDGQSAFVTDSGTNTVTPIAVAGNSPGAAVTVGSGANAVAVVGAGVADTSITETGPSAEVAPGTNATYTLTAANAGPNVSTGTTVTDTLPAGATLVSATASQGVCAQGPGGTVICNLSGLGVSGTATITIVVEALSAGSLTNVASVAGNEFDPNLANNTTSTTTTVGAAGNADLSVTDVASAPTIGLGGSETFTVTVANGGPSAASSVSVEDDLPAGLSFVSASSGCYQAATSTVVCPDGTLASGASIVNTVTATPTALGPATDDTEIGAVQPDPNMANNSASAMVDVTKAAETATAATTPSVAFPTPITDSVLIAGGANPTGTITYNLYGPGDSGCATSLATFTKTVSGNGAYTSAQYMPTTIGTYQWVASYGGDSQNLAVPGTCNAPNQSVTVTKGAQTVSFTSTAPEAANVGGPTYTPTATSSVGLTVAITLAPSSSGCSLSAGVVSFTGNGNCLIDANQAGIELPRGAAGAAVDLCRPRVADDLVHVDGAGERGRGRLVQRDRLHPRRG